MTVFTKPGQQIFAPVDENGNARSVSNQETQVWSTEVEAIIKAFVSSGGLIFDSKAALDADLAHDANSMAWVLGDATAANNGIYRKIGASAAGSWTRVGDLPYSFIIASDAGAGTPNAIIATTAIPVSESALVLLNVAETNTGSPVTVAFNGGAELAVKTNGGSNVVAGGLVSGMVAMGVVSGSTFRMVNDQVSSAIVEAAEAAAAAALAAANAGFVFDNEADFEVATIPDVLDFVETAGEEAPGDGGGNLWKKLTGAPLPIQPWHKQVDGKWLEIGEPNGRSISIKAFGAKLSGSQTPTQRRNKIQAAIDWACTRGYDVFIPAGFWEIQSDIFKRTGMALIGAGMFTCGLVFSNTAAAEASLIRPETYDGSVHGFYISDLKLDGNVDGRGITTVTSTQRPGGSNFSLNGARGGTVERVWSVNSNLHCIDICGPGELAGGVRDYVDPANMDQDFTFEPGDGTETGVPLSGTNRTDYPSGGYYPPGGTAWVRFKDCIAGNSGDDPITTHYVRNIWITGCRVTSGSNRHPGAAQGTSIGIEIDDGSEHIWVDGCHVSGCLKGIGVKAHDHNPAGRNIRVTNCTIEQCTVGISAVDPYDPSPVSPTARDVIFSDITIRNLAPQFGDPDLVAAIECLAYQGVIFDNITIDGNHKYSATYGSCIILGDAASRIIMTNITVDGWNPGETSTSLPLIFTTSSCKSYSLKGVRFKNSGGARGMTLSGTYYNVDDMHFHTPSVIGTSYAVLAAVDPLLSYGFVGHITKENFTYTTRLAGVDSVEGVYTIPHEVKSAGLTLFGPLNLGPYIAKTIVGGVLTLAREGVRYSIAGEGGVADELVTINGTNDGDIIIVRAASSTVDITVKHGVGNVYLNGKTDFVLSHSLDSLMFENHSGSLKQLGGGDNQT